MISLPNVCCCRHTVTYRYMRLGGILDNWSSSFMSDRKKSERANDVSRRDFIKSAVPGLEGVSRASQTQPERRILGINRPVSRRTFVKVAAGAAAITGIALALPLKLKLTSTTSATMNYKGKVKAADRQLAALNAKAAGVRSLTAPTPGEYPTTSVHTQTTLTAQCPRPRSQLAPQQAP